MVVLRLLAVFIFAGLLTGCMLADDVTMIKKDFKVVKAYSRAFSPPGSCKEPGYSQGRICRYKLKILTFDEDTSLFVGQVDTSVVEAGKTACEVNKKEILANHLATEVELQDYPCLDPEYYPYNMYGFKIVKGTPKLVGQVLDLENVPFTESLKIRTP